MKEDLLNYMSKRTESKRVEVKTGGPVVTISREKGCPSNSIAEKLAKQLIKKTGDKSWQRVTKEIIETSAKELHVNPSKINSAIYSEDKGFFRDLMLSFGEKYYQSDAAIKRTLAGLIRQFATKGKVIIVGIGGVAITKEIAKSLHIKLHAPYKWRLKEVMRMEGMNSEEARDYMDETDINRKMLIDYYNGLKAGSDLFHAHFNCSILSEDEIVKGIIALMEIKKLV